jgi:hypothetical protein
MFPRLPDYDELWEVPPNGYWYLTESDDRFWGRYATVHPYLTKSDWHVVSVRYGSLLAACALMPAMALLGAAFRSHRGRAGFCRKCGYDLRATPERCPECGIAPSKLGRGG